LEKIPSPLEGCYPLSCYHFQGKRDEKRGVQHKREDRKKEKGKKEKSRKVIRGKMVK
jgi:hypothetical protein